MTVVPLRPEAAIARGMFVMMVALMVTLGLVTFGIATALHRVGEDCRSHLAGAWTVVVPNEGVSHPADRLDSLVTILKSTPGVTEARPINPDELGKLLAPWLGDVAADPSLSFPRLIDVRIEPNHPPDRAALGRLIDLTVPGATLDDHGDWTRGTIDVLHRGELLGAILLAAIAAISALAIAAATRTRLAANWTEIELLHDLGATDSAIVRQFSMAAIGLSAVGALLGILMAVATALAVFRLEPDGMGIVSAIDLTAGAWTGLALVPVVAIGLVVLVVRWSTVSWLRRLP